MADGEFKLPALITLTDANGNWEAYLERVYAAFHHDFVASRPTFRGTLVGHRKYDKDRILPNGKEATFWHLISEGETEEDRTPDLRRCERIGWVRPLVEAAESAASEVRIWRQERYGKTNYALALPSFEFLVIMGWREPDSGPPYALPLTAFCPRENKRIRLEAEWKRNKCTL